MEESRNTMDNIENAETAINQGPPAGEPERQQYFMERAKRQLAELSAMHCHAAILGKSIYTGAIDLAEAVKLYESK